MKLSKYDNKLVRITDIDNIIFEGYCCHNCIEFNEIECGINEESLNILNIMFNKSCIKKVELIDDFSSKYGNLEELIISDEDYDFIEDALEREDDIHNKRLILCIKDNIDKFKDKDRINELIERFNKYGI